MPEMPGDLTASGCDLRPASRSYEPWPAWEAVISIEVALIHPEIPPNTGNVSRLCAGLDVPLHLVKPLGFELSDRHLRRAGLDYWPLVKLSVHESYADFEQQVQPRRLCFATAFATTLHWDFTFQAGDVLVFGKETAGLPRDLWEPHPDRTIRIPHWGQVRSLNLSNAVAVIAYEAMRQLHGQGKLAPPIPRAPDRQPE